MSTVRIVLEFEVSKDPLDHALARATYAEEFTADLRKEEHLEQVLLANPALERQAVLNKLLVGHMHSLSEFFIKGKPLDQVLDHEYRPVLPLLLELAPEAAREALRAYFLASGALGSDESFNALALERVNLDLCRVVVEDEQGQLATSDKPKPVKKKNKQ